MNNKFKPGEGRRKKFAFDKGRQVDLLALEKMLRHLFHIIILEETI